MKEIKMNDKIHYEPYKDCLVSEIVHEPGAIFSLIKHHHLNFSDEVLKEAHITKTIRDVRCHS